MEKVFSGEGEVTFSREDDGTVGIMIKAQNNAMKVKLSVTKIIQNLRELGLVK